MTSQTIPQSILVAIVAINTPLEGSIAWLYKDSKGYPTIGVGLWMPDLDSFLRLPMIRKDTKVKASLSEKARDWSAVQRCGNGSEAAAHVTELELSGPAITAICNAKLEENETHLRAALGGTLDVIPWDMRVCLHSLSYAMGSGFLIHFPKFHAALLRGDYLTDEEESDMPEGEDGRNPNLHPRNVLDGLLCRNTAEVVKRGWESQRVYWPDDLSKLSADATCPEVLGTSDVTV